MSNKVRFVVAKGCGFTGKLIQRLVQKQGVQRGAAGGPLVSWGCRLPASTNALNSQAGGEKLSQLLRLHEAGVSAVKAVTSIQELGFRHYPVLARKRYHKEGRDIRVCNSQRQAYMFLANGWDFLSPVIPSRREYRVWIYRQMHLGSYVKVLRHPAKQKAGSFGRNFRNGWAFELLKTDQVNRKAVLLAARAVAVLDLDFGAVDILEGTDGQLYVLEVNTAPGVEGEGRQCIQLLASKIANWVLKGCPKRKEQQDA